jgi:hypothetical protein
MQTPQNMDKTVLLMKKIKRIAWRETWKSWMGEVETRTEIP